MAQMPYTSVAKPSDFVQRQKIFPWRTWAEGIRFAHEHGVKVYVTANILAHNDDLDGARAYFEELKAIEPDALIISRSWNVYHRKRSMSGD